ALLPMAFVSGLMGPYMSPIPINASMGMFISLAVAFIVTPWMFNRMMSNRLQDGHVLPGHSHGDDALHRLFQRGMGPFLAAEGGKSKRRRLWLVIGVLILLSVGLAGVKLVVMKMLPFDNKSEFQVIVDMPEGTSVEQTSRVLAELGAHLATVPEVTDYQVYAGTAAPINFNGLVRQYYLREDANVGDIQVNLVDKHLRDRQSHEIAASVRVPLQTIAEPFGANVKIVEVPPGPPVQAPLVAEVYGPDYAGQIQLAKELEVMFAATDDVVDVDTSVESSSPKYILHVDQQRAALLGVTQQMVVTALSTVLSGEDVSYLHGAEVKYPLPIRLEFPVADKVDLQALLALKVRSGSHSKEKGSLVALANIATVEETTREQTIYHKDQMPVVFVTSDVAGEIDSPLYGMFDIFGQLLDTPLSHGRKLPQTLISQPEENYDYSLKWDGEWQVTYETFRDMGIAYGVGLILIYLLVVAQFRSYMVPLIIMAPIPLTIIGVMPGHALLGKPFTATSMIGMIAMAGIIVRNSILLVDFINQELRNGVALDQAVIRAGAVRSKPIVLTGLAAMLGAFFILDDPIFSGLAISLIFGIFISTLLTLLVIPLLYYVYLSAQQSR
ncbi:MAG: efflux RND transporter permease subunit, partial [Gammaproteobacteria bacterium]|nr:efflux RND transporter permease subunit [Gammaproteobacteria bacterium]